MDVLRRMIPRKMKRDQYSFELLKSTSAIELSSSVGRRDSSSSSTTTPAPLPRNFSHYDSIRIAPSTQSALTKKKSEEVIDVSEGEMTEFSSLIGFVAGPRQPGCSYGFAQEDPSYEKSISECHAIQEKRDFTEGVLLKCIDRRPLFPYLHFAQFRNQDYSQRIKQISDVVRECSPTQGSLYGCYDEVYSIQKTATVGENRLPAHRHAGYIVIGFKLLDDASKQQTLEKTWLSWSGAREIYKHSPRNWNLRRISLMRCPSNHRNGMSRPFAYILMCEYGSILHPSNTIQALDICERLRVRNCGHIALYQVHTVYSSPIPRPSSSSNNSPSRQSAFSTMAATKRAQMLRGFSQDVDSQQQQQQQQQQHQPTTTQQALDSSSLRRSRMLRTRERSFQYPDEYYHAYQPHQFDTQTQY